MPRVVDGADESVLVHDVACPSPARAFTLAQLDVPDYPVPVGVFRRIEAPSLDREASEQMERLSKEKHPALQSLVEGPSTWRV